MPTGRMKTYWLISTTGSSQVTRLESAVAMPVASRIQRKPNSCKPYP